MMILFQIINYNIKQYKNLLNQINKIMINNIVQKNLKNNNIKKKLLFLIDN